MQIVNFCEKCGTKANESARFCSSCGFALISAPNTPEETKESTRSKTFKTRRAFLITISLSVVAVIALVVLPNVFKSEELIKIDELKLVVGDSAYTWVGTYPQFKVVLQSKETNYKNVALHVQRQDARGEWSSVLVKEVARPGLFNIVGKIESKEGKAIYRALIVQGERLVTGSETKQVTFVPKKKNFTYEGNIGYRYFELDEYKSSPCPATVTCVGAHVVSKAKVTIKAVIKNPQLENLTKPINLDITAINKVQSLKLPITSLSKWYNSVYMSFVYTSKALTAKDLKRIALAQKKKQQNKPTPIPSTQPEPCEINNPKYNKNTDGWCKRKIEQKIARDEAFQEEYLRCIARYLNEGDPGGTIYCKP